MNNKKKIIAICVCVALLAGTILSGTIAYFTDDEAITNTFTSGNIDMILTEYTDDGEDDNTDLDVVNPEKNIFSSYKLFPEDVITKKPVITFEKDSEDAYVAAIITVTAKDLNNVSAGKTPVVTDGKLNPEPLIQSAENSGILNSATDCADTAAVLKALAADENAVVQKVTTDDNGNTVYTFYLFVEAVQEDTSSITLFDTLNVPANWDNAEMDLLKGLKIDVKAYAVQAKHLDNCHDAMVSAFQTEFAAVPAIAQP